MRQSGDRAEPMRGDKERKRKGACTGSAIEIVARTPTDLSATFTKKASDAMVASGSGEITVPGSTTAIEQDERGTGKLDWSCPGGKRGAESGRFKHAWKREGAKLSPHDGNKKRAYDGHIYGLCCLPGSEARKAAEKSGFDIDRCSWTFVANLSFETKAVSGAKTQHRCKWGFRFKATHSVSQGGATKKASVKYWGVDQQIET